jgi:glycogen debranching enzyme
MGKNPTWYPTACSPQAWSAATGFLLLKATIGLSIDASAHRVVLRRPVLPEFLDRVRIYNLAVGDAALDLCLFRSGDSVAVTVERRTGNIEVMVVH